jgi:predicted PurR-regulated permease PerM
VLLSIVSILALFIVIPVVAGYMTAESRAIRRSLLGYLPRKARLRAARIIHDLDRVVGGFIRGQLVVAAIVGTLVTLLLLGLHVPYAPLIGLVAGTLDVIPYVGAVAGWLPPLSLPISIMVLGTPLPSR